LIHSFRCVSVCELGVDPSTKETVCAESKPNEWLTFLYVVLASIRFAILGFGPLLFISAIGTLIREETPYTVKLRDPLIKTILLCRSDTPVGEDIKATHTLNLRSKRGFPKLRESVYNAPVNISSIQFIDSQTNTSVIHYGEEDAYKLYWYYYPYYY